MKKLSLLIISLLICLVSLQAQDTIVLHNGSKIISKVMEIKSTGIKYKFYPDADEVEYDLQKNQIEKIHFRSGKILNNKEIFQLDSIAEPEYINDIPVGEEILMEDTSDFATEYSTEINDFPMELSYKEKFNIYHPSPYRSQRNDPYIPALAGIASYFIPGLGQIYSGETGRGFAFMGGAFGSYMVASAGIMISALNAPNLHETQFDSYYTNGNRFWQITGAGLATAGITAALGIHIWNIVDAVQVAKVNNMYFQDKRKNQLSLQVKPFIGTNSNLPQNNKHAGLTFSLTF